MIPGLVTGCLHQNQLGGVIGLLVLATVTATAAGPAGKKVSQSD